MIRRARCYLFGHDVGWLVLGRRRRAGCSRCGRTFKTATWDEVKHVYASERALLKRGRLL